VSLIEKRQLLAQISPPLDNFLADQLLEEFISMERRYIQSDWEPAELDGGQFAEVLARVIYHMDSGNLSPGKDFSECLAFVEDEDNKHQNKHQITPRHDALHLAKVLRTIYKFRSQRGAVHISPTYKANAMDSKFLIECVRWCIMETLRIFWQGDREKVAKAIRELIQFDVPCIGTYEGAILVQRTDLTADEEVLVLLHYAGEVGYSRAQLGQHSLFQAPRITEALQRLVSREVRQVILAPSGRYQLTALGSKRIREQLADKLLLG
jgi:hypothetical protein